MINVGCYSEVGNKIICTEIYFEIWQKYKTIKILQKAYNRSHTYKTMRNIKICFWDLYEIYTNILAAYFCS